MRPFGIRKRVRGSKMIEIRLGIENFFSFARNHSVRRKLERVESINLEMGKNRGLNRV